MFFVSSVIILNAGGSLLRLLEAFVFTVRSVLVLDHSGSLGHLLPVQILKQKIRQVKTGSTNFQK